MLCSEIDIMDPIDSQPVWYGFGSCSTRDTSASDDPVSVETGLVLAEVSELHDWFGARRLRRVLFSRKNPSRTCSSSCEDFDLPFITSGFTLPPSSSGFGKENGKRTVIWG